CGAGLDQSPIGAHPGGVVGSGFQRGRRARRDSPPGRSTGMTSDQIIGMLAQVTLVEMMCAVGLGTSAAAFVLAAPDGRLVARVAVTVLLGQVLPLLAGLAVSRWRPGVAQRLVGPARRGAMLLNVAFLVLVLVAQYRILLQIKPMAWVGMLTLLVSCVVIGWL